MVLRCIFCVLLSSVVFVMLAGAEQLPKCSIDSKQVQCSEDEETQKKKTELLIKSGGLQKKTADKTTDKKPQASVNKQQNQKDIFYAKKLDQAYSQVKTMQADFVQEYIAGLKEKSAKGKVYISRPGKMKWDYASPKGKFFLADGEHLSLYDPAFGQVMQSDQASPDQAPIGLALLFGQKKASSMFHIEMVKEDKKTVTLKLTPKEAVPNIEQIQMVLEKASVYSIKESKVIDVFGGENTLRFNNIKNNIKLSASVFKFKKPKNAKIVSTDNFSL
ncbi:outer membrane lipoprotein carrier protein LolA [bacterium]|nr:outer membrane lipoprotein carrier protein LolA [bacterium]